MNEKVVLFESNVDKVVLQSEDGKRHEYKKLALIEDSFSKYIILQASILEDFNIKVFLVNDCGFYIPITNEDKINYLLSILEDAYKDNMESIRDDLEEGDK